MTELRWRLLLVATVLSLVTVGCAAADGEPLAASDEPFAGLDPAVVQEVLASTAAQERVAGDEPTVAAARYQGMVRNFIACRAALDAYEEWVRTGVAPPLAKQPRPTHPAPTAADMDRDIEALQKDLASGDITLLRDSLTNPTGCGDWIPAKPGDQDGPTIAQVVQGAGT